MEDLTPIKICEDGSTDPFVPPGTEIVIIQDGNVAVGKLFYKKGDINSFYISHPKNQQELSNRAAKVITQKKPEFLKTEDMMTVTCPADIKKDMKW